MCIYTLTKTCIQSECTARPTKSSCACRVERSSTGVGGWEVAPRTSDSSIPRTRVFSQYSFKSTIALRLHLRVAQGKKQQGYCNCMSPSNSSWPQRSTGHIP